MAARLASFRMAFSDVLIPHRVSSIIHAASDLNDGTNYISVFLAFHLKRLLECIRPESQLFLILLEIRSI